MPKMVAVKHSVVAKHNGLGTKQYNHKKFGNFSKGARIMNKTTQESKPTIV
jgi:hypothetical protein